MRWRFAALLMVGLASGCRSKTGAPDGPAIAAAPEEKKPAASSSWLSSIKKPVVIRIQSPASDAGAIRPFVALVERYGKVKPDLTVATATGEPRRIEISYGGKTTAVVGEGDGLLWSDVAGTSYLLARALHDARDAGEGIQHRVGFLVGRGQPGREALAAQFAKERRSYALEAVDTHGGDEPIPADLEALIVTAPREGITRKELRRVDEFLMRGKSVALLTSGGEVKDADPSMNVHLGASAMSELLAGYGVRASSTLVVDKRQLWALPKKKGLAEAYPFLIVADASTGAFDPRTAPFFALRSVPVPLPTELTIDAARASLHGAKTAIVLRTTDTIITVKGTEISAHPSPARSGMGATGQKEEKRVATLGVTLDGTLGSAFDKPGDGVDSASAVSSGRARLLVLSSASFLGNVFRDAGKSPFGGLMPGMDPNMGADEELLEYATLYDPLAAQALAATTRICDWLLRRDLEIEP